MAGPFLSKTMKNKYLSNLNKIEFVITNACTGRCKHCSEGDHASVGECIDPALAAKAVKSIASEYGIKTVLAFGGEPLLYPACVCAIISAAREAGVPRRQVITNGFFSRDPQMVKEVAEQLFLSGVNDLLLSVDAFHEETIPLDAVKAFAREAKALGIPMRLQPAWLKSRTDSNPYNEKTREILSACADLEIPVGEGNVVFPEGNAKIYLAEYFTDGQPQNPYEEDPDDVHCVSFSPNGDVFSGNAYKQDIMDILKDYKP